MERDVGGAGSGEQRDTKETQSAWRMNGNLQLLGVGSGHRVSRSPGWP